MGKIQRKWTWLKPLTGLATLFLILARVNDKTTNILYQLHFDPAGNLPPRVVQFTTIKRPLETITGLRRMVNNEIYYQRAGLMK